MRAGVVRCEACRPPGLVTVGSALSRRGPLGRDCGGRGPPVRGPAAREASIRAASVRAASVRAASVRAASVRAASVRGLATEGAPVRGPAARGPADLPRSVGGRSKALPAAGLADQVFPARLLPTAEVLPAAGRADRDAPAAGLPARGASTAWPDRAVVAAGLPGQVFRAAGLPALAPLAGLAPAVRARRRSGNSGIEVCTFPGNALRVTRERVTLNGKMSGGVLLSHAVARAVPSAQKGLASGFGMGPGVSLSL